jgi:GPH family glycoside/pentoside/hexuronide:cation symporter
MKFLRKLAYSSGAVATALSYQAFTTYVIFFYVDGLKLPPYLAAIAILIYGIWNAINDPLMGYISDHTHSRWGRRVPYIAFGAIPFGLAYFLIWVPPFDSINQLGLLFTYFVLMLCLFDGIYTMTVLNWAALFPEMFTTLRERSLVNALRQSFGMLGLVLGIALPPIVYGSLGWGWMGAIFGSIASIALLITLWGCHEHMEYSHEKQLPLLASFKATLKNRSFLTFVFANFFIQYAFTLMLATVPFFAKYVLQESAQGTAAVVAIAFLTALPTLYLWEHAAIRMGAKWTFIAAVFAMMIALFPLFFIQTLGGALCAAFLIGIGLSGFILVADILLSDVIDEDEVATGTRREGLYFGASAFITRFAIALEAVSMGVVFTMSGYNPYVYTQTRDFVGGLRFLIAALPMVALVFAFVLIWFYPLSGKKLEAVKSKLKELHAQKGTLE